MVLYLPYPNQAIAARMTSTKRFFTLRSPCLQGLTPELSRPAQWRQRRGKLFCHAVAVTKQVRLERFVGRDVAGNPQPPQACLGCGRSRATRSRGESLSALPLSKRSPGHAQSHRQLIELTEDGNVRNEPGHARCEVDRRTGRQAKRKNRRRSTTTTNCS